jgi:hypothetical protein
MPAGMYRRVRPDEKNPHPIMVTRYGSRPSCDQVTDNVLCPECEGRFDRLGENYTLRYAADRDRFRLLEELEASKPSYSQKEWRGYSNADTPQIKRDELAYFALSVFWRAAAHRWPETNGKGFLNGITLGKDNTEALRLFLLGEGPVPATMSLFFVVLTDHLSQGSFYLPTMTSRQNFCWGFGFFACGLMFNLNVGRRLEGKTDICLMKSAAQWIWVRNGEAKTLEAFSSLIARQPPDVRLK